jgi:hypothetical protein
MQSQVGCRGGSQTNVQRWSPSRGHVVVFSPVTRDSNCCTEAFAWLGWTDQSAYHLVGWERGMQEMCDQIGWLWTKRVQADPGTISIHRSIEGFVQFSSCATLPQPRARWLLPSPSCVLAALLPSAAYSSLTSLRKRFALS